MTEAAARTPLRVLLVAPWPPPEGGMAVQARGLAAALRERGVAVVVVPTNVGLGPLARVRGLRGAVNLWVFLVRLLLAVRRVDVVHVLAASGLSFFLFAAPAVLAGRLAGRRVIVNYRGGLAEPFLERRIRWVRPVLARCHRLVVPSAYLEEIFRRHGFAPEVVPNYIALARFAPAAAAREGARILVTRNLEPIYGVAHAIDAFAHVRRRFARAELVIAGTGSERTALEARVRAQDIGGVTFLGRVANEAIPALYAGADLALNPALVDNMPISVLEAFAAGVAVVSTRAGGVSCLVEDRRTGMLVEPGDVRGLAAAILRLLRRPAHRRALARAGRRHVEAFDLPRVVAAWEAIYREEAAARAPA
ncbi:MAG: glycosyltransferase family 4 protein [Planctomycetes bacterium]|nr:glycosyltransferase family 4 protein [Planctomycetota bacterium]